MRPAHCFPAFLLTLCVVISARAQSFCKKYNPPDNIYSTVPWAVSQRPDGKYWMASGVYEAPSRLYITGLDEQGQPFISARISANQSDSGEGYVSGNMTATVDNGCAMLLSQSVSSQSDGWILVKTDSTAQVEWAKEIAGVGVAGYGVDFLNDSPDGIWVCSRLWALGNGLSQTYFARVGLDGTVFWEKVLVFSSFLGANTSLLPDGRLLAILNSGSLAPVGHLLAITPGGVLQPLLSVRNTVLMGAVQHPDGRLFFIGHTPDIATPESQLLLGCYQTGQIQWVKTFSLSKEYYTSADILLNTARDSLTIAVGNTTATGVRYLLRFDLSGQLAWARWLPSYENLQSHTAVTADDGFLWVSTSPDLKPVVAKTEANGQITGCQMARVCALDVRDTVLQATSPNWNFQSTTRMQDVAVTGELRIMEATDYCAPLPSPDAGILADSVACRGAALKFRRNPASAGFSEWRFPGVLPHPVSGVPAPTVAFPDTGIFVVTHLLTLAGCTDTAQHTIRILPLPQVDLPNDTILCPGASIGVTALGTPGVTYVWENGQTSSNRILTIPGTYGVSVSNAAGCTSSDKIIVSPVDLPGSILPADTFFCENATVTIAPAIYPGWQYEWQDGFPDMSRAIAQSGIFTLQAESAEGCRLADSIAVQKRLRPEITIAAMQPDSCGRQILTLQNSVLYQIHWNTGTTATALEVTKSGQYAVSASDGFCDNSSSIEVEIVRCPECFLYFPNIIRPDSGDENGVFAPQTGCAFSSFAMRIFDRWGALLFETRDVAQPWDGTFRGKPVPPGVYVFEANGLMYFENIQVPFNEAGSVAVVR